MNQSKSQPQDKQRKKNKQQQGQQGGQQTGGGSSSRQQQQDDASHDPRQPGGQDPDILEDMTDQETGKPRVRPNEDEERG